MLPASSTMSLCMCISADPTSTSGAYTCTPHLPSPSYQSRLLFHVKSSSAARCSLQAAETYMAAACRLPWQHAPFSALASRNDY